ncbi:hypothetical protein GQ55_5G410400 [Panicum hallii var. hallii]|uniref:Uncharacterized protein n=1 Tax=Panicum hallii var. hallii TaxID=1504633 RepID=A0A2T7DNP8_9POAL|nr:hypothetical protein GQ55_5G410400 [Panicum hallii var. hallii]PUZ57203.1 hypothetical protein GQ55_5G410400 [Panicum hallii var. hallii]
MARRPSLGPSRASLTEASSTSPQRAGEKTQPSSSTQLNPIALFMTPSASSTSTTTTLREKSWGTLARGGSGHGGSWISLREGDEGRRPRREAGGRVEAAELLGRAGGSRRGFLILGRGREGGRRRREERRGDGYLTCSTGQDGPGPVRSGWITTGCLVGVWNPAAPYGCEPHQSWGDERRRPPAELCDRNRQGFPSISPPARPCGRVWPSISSKSAGERQELVPVLLAISSRQSFAVLAWGMAFPDVESLQCGFMNHLRLPKAQPFMTPSRASVLAVAGHKTGAYYACSGGGCG